MDEDTIKHSRGLAEDTGIAYQTLINLYLRECAATKKKPSIHWKPAAQNPSRATQPGGPQMTEAEIVYQISEIFNRAWTLQQWWASISFGLLLVAHVASERLNGFLLTVLLTLYCAFTALVQQMLGRNLEMVHGYRESLQQIMEKGVALSPGSMVYAQPNPWFHEAAAWFALVGTFVGTCSYLVYRYWSEGQPAATRA